MTGSIKRQATQEAVASAAKSPAPSAPASIQQAAASLPVPSLPSSAPEASIATPPPAIAPLAMPGRTDVPAPWFVAPSPQTAAPTAEPVPLPPTRVASAPASEPGTERPRPAKVEFGVDIGGAPSLEVLNLRWAAVKANFGPLLNGLHPLAAHNRRPGSTDYRLLVGPLPNAAAASQLCARFVAARVTCRTSRFDGEQFVQR
jgi:hypothetical protein